MRNEPQTVSEALREAIRESGQSAREIERATGVHNGMLSRFLRDERGLSTPTVDKLANHLGLRLVKARRRSR